MLVVPDFTLWLGFGVLIVVVGWLALRTVRNLQREPAGSVLPGVVAALLVIGAVLVRLHTYDAVVVEDDGSGGLRGARALTIGEPDHDPKWVYAQNPTWIINRSTTHSIYLELVIYAGKVFGPPSRIGPGSVSVDERIDYLGPDDPPPDRGKIGHSVLWVRWKK